MGKRILGILFLIIGLIGITLSVAGVLLGRQLVQDLGNGAQEALTLTSETLDTVGETLIVTKDTVGRINDGMETLGTTAINVSKTISETGPMLDQVTKVTSEDVPDGLESVNTALPDVAEAAGAIDDALRVLSAFQVERSIFGVPISFDLGVEYNPTVPLDETVLQLGQSIEGMPDDLRDLEVHLDLASANLDTIGQNIETIATDLGSLSESANEIEPLIDDYIRIVTETGDLVREARAAISEQMELAELIVTLLFVWIGLNQIIPLYLAADLIRGEKKQN
jgi:methyl-accepting chemotaxis protein